MLALPHVRPWRYPPQLDAQYGEWLTDAELGDQNVEGLDRIVQTIQIPVHEDGV